MDGDQLRLEFASMEPRQPPTDTITANGAMRTANQTIMVTNSQNCDVGGTSELATAPLL